MSEGYGNQNREFLRTHYFDPFTEKCEKLEYEDQEWEMLKKYYRSLRNEKEA
jgi:hypothetical protein